MGYGFVLIDGNPDAEYFIHFTSIDMDGYKTLKAGQPVSFILKNTEKGIQATEVKIL
jgi:CspA family cold shock protein